MILVLIYRFGVAGQSFRLNCVLTHICEQGDVDFNSHEVAFLNDKLSLFNFSIRNRVTQWRLVPSGLQLQMKSWNKTRRAADTSCWCHANKVCVIYDIVGELYLNIVTFYVRGVSSEYSASMILLRLRPRVMQHSETKTIWYLPSLTCCEAFLITLHLNCHWR